MSAQTRVQSPLPRPGRFAGSALRPADDVSESLSKAVVPVARGLSSTGTSAPTVRRFSAVPESVQNDPNLIADMRALPSNYSFEIPKTVHRLRQASATCVALQMPEGLLMYATTISDILIRHSPVKSAVILADVTYGACCVDDISARAQSCDFLVHYGHSCLIPVTSTTIPTLYVFVYISFDSSHLQSALLHNFNPAQRIALVATIQFVDTAHAVRDALKSNFPNMSVPQKRPLSPGELLGCTSPKITDADVLVYIGDGRFHLESAMIANPNLVAFRYDPYSKRLTEERYATAEMHDIRKKAIASAACAKAFGVILGTLGRQGSPKILRRLIAALNDSHKSFFVVLLSEVTPNKLELLQKSGVQAWVQIACPRLSIDWGHNLSTIPVLNPYECLVALGKVQWRDVYPMDYYAKDGGEWSNYYKPDRPDRSSKTKRRDYSDKPKTDAVVTGSTT